jgi:uncharacterized protein
MPEIPLADNRGKLEVNLIDQKMRASVRIYGKENDLDVPLNLQDVLEALNKAEVIFGINEAIISIYIEEKKWGELFIAAEGIPPASGDDAVIEYHFPTAKSLKPHILEDGRIDYKDVDIIGSVSKDEILIKKIPPTLGTPGKNIMGDDIPGKLGKDINIVPGSGTYKDPLDPLIIKASTDGIVAFNSGSNTVEVQKLYVIQGSVDFSTGNVNVKSSVDIKGDVNPGFSISTPYNVNVKGMVEQAKISCDGTLTVKEGIVGEGKQLVKAGGDIHTGYIRNQMIKCGGSIYVSTEILSSTIECEDEIVMVKPEGKIIGGKLIVKNSINACTIGNKYNVPTEIELGINFEHREKYLKKTELINENRKQVDEIKKRLDLINSKPPDMGSNARFKTVKDQLQAALDQFERLVNDLKEIEKDYYNVDDPFLRVNKTIYPGVIIKIKHAIFEVNEELNRVIFRLAGTQISYTSIK